VKNGRKINAGKIHALEVIACERKGGTFIANFVFMIDITFL
jgi:hypothetical protein